MLWGLLSFKQHLLFGRSKSKPREAEVRLRVLRWGLAVDMQEQTPRKQKSGRKCFGGVWRWTCQGKPPGSRNQAESASAGFGGGHARANPREAEIRLKVLRRDLAVDMPQQTPGKQKSGRKRMSTRGVDYQNWLWHVHRQTPPKHFRLDFCFPRVCSGMPPPNPAEALSAWFLLPGGLLWHVHRQTPPKHFRPDFCFRGFALACPPPNPAEALSASFLLPGGCSGMSTAKPRRSTFGLISASRGLLRHIHQSCQEVRRWFPERDCILEH